jgi:apolipoprotein N-acyltransferase
MEQTMGQVDFPLPDRRSWLWLAVAAAILPFANGLPMVPIAAWLAPIFLVRFLRTQKTIRGLLVGYVVSTVAFFVQWYPAFQDAGAMFALYTGAFGLLVYLPYVADRLLAPRLRGFAGTLVLPAAWVVMEYALHLLLPLGTFFNIAYTQSSNLPLLQIMSVTGLWAVSFLVAWCAGVVNYAWERGFEVRQAGRGVAVYAAVLLAVVFFGGLRLALWRPAGPTVQVAVLTTNVDTEVWPELDTPLDQRLMAGTLTSQDREEILGKMAAINDDLLARTRTVARGGARIVTWTEYNAAVFAADEAQFLDRAQQVAREQGIYLAFPLLVFETDVAKRPAPLQAEVNKSVMITPAGEIAYEYVKHNLLIGPESERAVRGPREIQSIDTPYGKLASVICLDMEYPDYMRQAGRQGVDIMLSGAIDGTAASLGHPLHSIMASYRTIEEGFSLARGGAYGQNVAVDYQGRLVGAANHYTAGDRTVVAHLPVQGTGTLYTVLGDFLPWSCILALAGFVIYAIVRR